MSCRILIAEPERFSEAARLALAEAGDVDLVELKPCSLNSAFQTYDVIWVRLRHRITAEMIGANPRCRESNSLVRHITVARFARVFLVPSAFRALGPGRLRWQKQKIRGSLPGVVVH